MAVTVVPQQQQQQGGGAENLLSVMNSINQRRKEVEEQQRAMEYEFINNYAASHGGFAGIAAMPGGDKMLQHYATNVMGYSPEVVPQFQQAIEQGYNPDEALYQINRNLMFQNAQQTGQTDQVVETQQNQGQGPTRQPEVKTQGAAIANALDPFTKEVNTQPQMQYMPSQNYPGSMSDPNTGQREAAQAQKTKDIEQMQAQQQRQGGMETRMDIQTEGENRNVDEITAAVVKQTSYFPNNTVPYYDRQTAIDRLGKEEGKTAPVMNENQKKLYNSVKHYTETTTAQTTTDFLRGVKRQFDAVGAEEIPGRNPGKDKAGFKQVENRAKKALRNLPNIKDYANLSPEQSIQYRNAVDTMMTNDPQRWAETYKQAFETKKAVTDEQYKSALTDLVKMQAGAQQMDMLLKQQQLNNPEQAEAATAMQMLQLFFKNPSLASQDEFKDAATAASGIALELFGNMLNEDGTVKASLKQNPLRPWNFWKSAVDRGFSLDVLVGEAGGAGQVAPDIVNDFLRGME